MPQSRTNRRAIWALVLAVGAPATSMALLPILWIVAFAIGVVLAIAALAAGLMALRQIDSSTQTGQAFAWSGIVLATTFLLLAGPATLFSFMPQLIDQDAFGPPAVPTCVGVSC